MDTNEKMKELSQKFQVSVMQLQILEGLKKGERNPQDQKIESFEIRKNNLKREIEELEKQRNSNLGNNLERAYNEAHNKLDAIALAPREGNQTTPEELVAMQAYKQARNLHDTASIINAIENANKLDETSEIKEALIETITALNANYLSEKTEEEKQQLNSIFNPVIEEEITNEPTEEERLLNNYTQAHNKLEAIALAPREGNQTTPEELKAMQAYKQARNLHDTASIINAIEIANNLSETSDVKEALIEAVTALNENYLSEKTEEEKEQLNNIFNPVIEEEIIDEPTEEERLLNAYTEAHNKLEEIALAPREGSYTTPEELISMQVYKQARNLHDTTSIINAIENANKLPETSEIKPALIEAITALNANYLSEKTEEEKEQLNSIFNPVVEEEIIDEPTEEERLLNKYTEVHNKLEAIALSPREGNQTTPEELVAMQSYKQARNLHDTASIINAIENANKLPETSDIKEALIEAITALNANYLSEKTEEEKEQLNNIFKVEEITTENEIDKKIAELKEKYMELLKEEEAANKKYTPLIEEKNNEILLIQQEMKKYKNNTENEPTESMPIEEQTELTVMPMNTMVDLPEQPYEPENTEIEEENQIIPTEEENQIIPTVEEDIPPVKEPFNVPRIIKSVKQAGNNLLEKINNFDFKGKKDKALEYMKKHAVATLIGASALIVAGTTMLGTAIENSKDKENNDDAINNNNPTIESEIETPVETETKEVKEETSVITEEEKFEAEIQATVNNIMNGEQVHSNIYDANADTNSINTTESQRENSWANAEATTFYSDENELLSREQAEQVIANGGEVVARFDNNNIPIGYAQVGQQVNEDVEITK